MRTKFRRLAAAAFPAGCLLLCAEVRAATVIDLVNRYAYGANLGWLDCRADGTNGAVIGEYVCSGYIYSANTGWINLGGGASVNGIYYQNNSAADFGVNQDGLGNLRGYAYGANIGWINFENTGAPRVDLRTGNFTGYAYSANCGWLSLSNTVAFVRTDHIAPGVDSNHDGIPDAWELQNFGTINVNVNADPDHDGMSNLQEYQAGTNPNDAGSSLRVTAESFGVGGTPATLSWSSVPIRYYFLQKTPQLAPADWQDSGLGLIAPSAGSTTSGSFADSALPMRFYRVQAVRPLAP